jgi:hypothetical protein
MRCCSITGALVLALVGCPDESVPDDDALADDDSSATDDDDSAAGDDDSAAGDDDSAGDDDDSADPLDADGDGYRVDVDCDDHDPAVHPGAWEDPDDGFDGNCDGIDANSLGAAPVIFVGEEQGNYAGRAVASAGDVDGDGLDDLLVGAPHNDDGGTMAGKAYLLLGSSLPANGSYSVGDADASFVGESSHDLAGWTVASAGDTDGDGLDDVLIGAYSNSQGAQNAGKTYVFRGATVAHGGDFPLSTADVALIGFGEDTCSASALASAGDVDGDGLADVLVGAPNDSHNGDQAGKTYLVLGVSMLGGGNLSLAYGDASFVGESQHDNSGWAVASAGDVDGDGLDDLLVGAPEAGANGMSSGAAYLVLGSMASAGGAYTLANVHARLAGEDEFDRAGYSLAPAGDVDGDGLADVLVGAYRAGGGANAYEAGRSYLVLGASLATGGEFDLVDADGRFIGERLGDMAGSAVASAGDVDGDGLSDLLIAAAWHDDETGKVYLLLGASTWYGAHYELETADVAFVGEAGGDYAGRGISPAGDIDGDGRDDLLIGASNAPDTYGELTAGRVYLLPSPF